MTMEERTSIAATHGGNGAGGNTNAQAAAAEGSAHSYGATTHYAESSAPLAIRSDGTVESYVPPPHPTDEVVPNWMRSSKKRMGPRPILGNSTSACGGCCIFATDATHGIILVGVLLFPVIVFLTSVVPRTEWYSFVVVLLLTLWAMLMQFWSTSCDPGIIPAAPEGSPPPEPGFLIKSNGDKLELKVCPTCNIVRPPRSSHCTTCDYCVEEFDHHCGVVGSCVAKRTFRFFTLYFYAIVLDALYVFVRSVIFLTQEDIGALAKSGHLGRWKVIAAIGCCVYTSCAGLCVCGQGVMYTGLACTNETVKSRTQMTRVKTGRASVVYDDDDSRGGYSCSACCCRLLGPMPKSRV